MVLVFIGVILLLVAWVHYLTTRYNVGIARRVVADSRMVAPNC
jgi:hypothetical protein